VTNTGLSEWRAIVFCCVPTVIVATIAGLGVTISGTILSVPPDEPLVLVLIVLALLVCPLHMVWVLWHVRN
jgi:hypothetical protein